MRKKTAGTERRVKAEGGATLIEKGADRKRWAEYFERLLSVEEDREPVTVSDC